MPKYTNLELKGDDKQDDQLTKKATFTRYYKYNYH